MAEPGIFLNRRPRALLFTVIGLLCWCTFPPEPSPAAPEPKKKEHKNVLKGKAAEDLAQLKREVDALETLYHLEPSERQLTGLLSLAENTSAKPKAIVEAQASPQYRKVLEELHIALAKDEEEKIEALNEKLTEVHDAEDVEIEDEFDITDAALKAAPAALKLLTPAQVVSYLASRDDEVPDPVDRIIASLTEGDEMAEEDWKSLRDETSEEVGWLTHGFDNDAAKATTKEAAALLDRGHKLKGDALKKEMPTIEKSARKLMGNVGPTAVLQHFMQRDLAEFLSNPRAVAALKARLEHAKK